MGDPGAAVAGLAEFDGEVVAAAGLSVRRWDGSTWQMLGTAFNSTVLALTVFEGDLITGGGFGAPGNLNVARWDGAAWQMMGIGMPCCEVHAFAVYNGELVAGANVGVLRWDGSSWQRVQRPQAARKLSRSAMPVAPRPSRPPVQGAGRSLPLEAPTWARHSADARIEGWDVNGDEVGAC
jgi:hypothetical protein